VKRNTPDDPISPLRWARKSSSRAIPGKLVLSEGLFSKLTTDIRAAKAFVFDFYNTLVEDDISVPAMWQQLNQLGYSSGPELQAMFEPDAFDGCTTPNFHSIPNHDEWYRSNWRRFVLLSGVPDHLVDSTLSQLLDLQDEFTSKSVAGAASILNLLRLHNLKIGLCSNWESPIARYLDQAQLPPFDAISISAEVGARKPHVAIFNDICSKLSVDPSEAVFVGDNWCTDIAGALRSSLVPVWIRRGRRSRGLPHLVMEFDTLPDLETYLGQLL
jgi:FMN phosphatase YigB (HAD superfamily)